MIYAAYVLWLWKKQQCIACLPKHCIWVAMMVPAVHWPGWCSETQGLEETHCTKRWWQGNSLVGMFWECYGWNRNSSDLVTFFCLIRNKRICFSDDPGDQAFTIGVCGRYPLCGKLNMYEVDCGRLRVCFAFGLDDIIGNGTGVDGTWCCTNGPTSFMHMTCLLKLAWVQNPIVPRVFTATNGHVRSGLYLKMLRYDVHPPAP